MILPSSRLHRYTMRFPAFKVMHEDVIDFTLKMVLDQSSELLRYVSRSEQEVSEIYASMMQQMQDAAIMMRGKCWRNLLPSEISSTKRLVVDMMQVFVLAPQIVVESRDRSDIVLWITFLANLDTIIQSVTEPIYLFRLLENECDHVHNGFRSPGAVNSTIVTRLGYYYRCMQPGYIHRYEQMREMNGLTNKLVARYVPLWNYQESLRQQIIEN
jgi:hypothetical protein